MAIPGISEKRKDLGKVTMEGLKEVTKKALSNGRPVYHPRPPTASSSPLGVRSQPHLKFQSKIAGKRVHIEK